MTMVFTMCVVSIHLQFSPHEGQSSSDSLMVLLIIQKLDEQ